MHRALPPASPLLLLRLPPQLQAQPVRSGSALDTYLMILSSPPDLRDSSYAARLPGSHTISLHFRDSFKMQHGGFKGDTLHTFDHLF